MSEMKYMSEFNKRALEKSYKEAYTDEQFKRLVKKIDVEDKIAMKYTTSLQESIKELNNCANCKGLVYCQNSLEGHAKIPAKKRNQIIFSYCPCKYQQELKKREEAQITRDKDILSASMKDIDLTDKNRSSVIIWLKKFCDTFEKNGNFKGLYLHGTFGCGKTYLISAAFNELAKKRITTEIVYYPELLRDLKSDFDTFSDRIVYLEEVDLLLIDDIGAEKVTEWSRDEILGTILQKRMNNYKTTFFTSNLNIEELEQHLIISSNIDEKIKARRIIERVKQLTIDMEMIGENKRN